MNRQENRKRDRRGHFKKIIVIFILYLAFLPLLTLNKYLVELTDLERPHLHKEEMLMLQATDEKSVDKAKEKQLEKDGRIESMTQTAAPYAVIHVGPHKTGSTSIQTFLIRSVNNTMKDDGYFVPILPMKGRKQKRTSFLAHCFVNKTELDLANLWFGCTPDDIFNR